MRRPTHALLLSLAALAVASPGGSAVRPDAVVLERSVVPEPAAALPSSLLRLSPPRSTVDARTGAKVVTANPTSYLDSSGENPAAPDITTLQASNDDAGNVTFRADVPNRPTLTDDMLLTIYVDSDANPTTGDPDELGTEYAIDVARGQVGLFAWDGTNYTRSSAGPPATTLAFSYAGGLTVRINRSELANASALNFSVVAVSGVAYDAAGNPIFDAAVADLAPDADAATLYAYQVLVPPGPGPGPRPEPGYDHYRDATKLPARDRYTGPSIKHRKLGEQLYRTTKSLGIPRVVSIACWSRTDWPTIYASTGSDSNPNNIAGFWHPRLPRWVHVAPGECANVQALMTTRKPNGKRAYSLGTVLHERLHAQGIENEPMTECFAVQLVYDFARTLGFPHPKAMRLELLAVRKSRALAPRGYWDSRRCRDGGAWDLFDEFRNLDY